MPITAPANIRPLKIYATQIEPTIREPNAAIRERIAAHFNITSTNLNKQNTRTGQGPITATKKKAVSGPPPTTTVNDFSGTPPRPVSQEQIDAFKACMMAHPVTNKSQINQIMANIRNLRMPDGSNIMTRNTKKCYSRAKRKERWPFFIAAKECFRTKAQAAVHTIAKPKPGQITNESEVKEMAEMAKALFGASRMPNIGEEARMERQASFDQALKDAQDRAMKRINAAQSIHRKGQHNMQERLTV